MIYFECNHKYDKMQVTFELEELVNLEDGDILGYFTESHVDASEFLQGVLEEYDYNVEAENYRESDVMHQWWRNEIWEDDPSKEIYSQCLQTDTGAYPVTAIYL